jgi:type VI secretion system secreted protein Hcp
MASGNNLYLDMGADFKGTAVAKPAGSAPTDMNGKIELESWSWGMTQLAAPDTGKNQLKGGGEDVAHISFTHAVDPASPLIMAALLKKKELPKVTLSCYDAKENKYLEIGFAKCYVSHLSTGGANGVDVLMETFTVTFNSFEAKYSNGKGGTTPCAWPS